MKKYNEFINESVRDLMKPKSDEEILKKFSHLSPDEKVFRGVEKNCYSLVKRGIDEGGNVNFSNLDIPIMTGNVELVELLVENGRNIKEYGGSHLNFACDSGNLEMVKLLVEKYDINVNSINKTKVINLIEKGFIDIVKYLCEKRSDLKPYIKKRADVLNNKAKIMYKCIE